MKKKITGLALSTMLVLFVTNSSVSQGRENGHYKHGHKKGHGTEWNDRTYVREYHYGGDRYVLSGNHYNHYRVSPWMKRHHPHVKTRYVYFRDYNVYYDYNRNVYMTLSERNWVFSVELPLSMRRAEPHRVVYLDVDYLGDDLYGYHSRSHRIEKEMYCLR